MVKHRNPLLQWAARWHYPYLSLDDGSHIPHGELAWRRFVRARNPKRTALAWTRVHRWNELIDERTA